MEKKRFEQIDGIRALAIFLVVASHTSAFGLHGQGGLGVDIFFVLSGFFCILPFLKEKKGYKDFKSVIKYYIKKIIRIIPLYYIVLLSAFFIDGKTNNIVSTSDLIKNMFFIECDGHLWYLQQEMFFYLIAPLLIQICCFASSKLKIKDKYMSIILFLSSILLNTFLGENVIHFFSNGQNQKIRIGIFLLGFAFGYIYNYLSSKEINLNKYKKYIIDIVSFIIILTSIFSAAYFISLINPNLEGYFVGWKLPLICSTLAGILIINLLINKDGILSKILSNKLITIIGKISYGIYLVHYFMLPYFKFDSTTKNFLVIFVISACLAYVSFISIEAYLNKIYKKIISIKFFEN